MDNSTTASNYAQEAYWNAVYDDVQYKASKNIGKYVMFIMFLFGTLGNLLSLATMVQNTMRKSSTAFYMASLAVADTMVLVLGCLRRWVVEVFEVDLLNEGPVACYIVNFLQYWSFDVAVWILVAMTLDRVIMVTSPLKAHIHATKKRAAIALMIILILCTGINLHFFFTTTHSNNICAAKPEHLEFFKNVWSWIDATIYSFLPFLLLLVLNIIILRFMSRANTKKQRMTNHFKTKKGANPQNSIASHKLTVMLLSVTCAFLLLTAPAVVIHILREMGEPFFDLNQPKDMAKYILTRQISRVLLYLNHSINFLLYCITGSKFRQELVAMVRCQSAKDRYRRRTVGPLATGSMAMTSYSRSASVAEPN